MGAVKVVWNSGTNHCWESRYLYFSDSLKNVSGENKEKNIS